ncbi:MAG TPA: hypothetical protein PLN06_02235 [Bacteroidales bacterium]|nr:hypothetical protein [Bacteroidales bacterium]HCI54836.1 hypothetical protein [Bacteroidales bacterium]HOU95428.1 hypothetical protein [Bacteroidales bacterium]HQG36136.1 hypothetical protein [Bacteroidales bacterium]HQG52103.1 hypothetical protein [Bacteroidales bacterium]
MNKYLSFVLLFFLICSCNSEKGGGGISEKNLKKEIIKSIEEYISNGSDKIKQSDDGKENIKLSAGKIDYLILFENMYIGDIDGNNFKDIIVPVARLVGGRPVMKEHIFFINDGGNYRRDTIIADIVNILKVEEGEIYAEVSKVGMDSPGYGCKECMEIKKYSYRGGRLGVVQ